ncbi:hypothetical protein L3X38_024193 [Prunus dulcis]|uniref:Uncharacterized protein n=1 Tax=Prunus dulcis TaxID=3755 RepID=A0AAD4Z5X2_PRUDU|nr:hypothetical protein L3X38_024193 [Prunus dulcis]
MLARRLVSLFNKSTSASQFSTLSALNDLVIYQSCSSKAMEKASKNPAIREADLAWRLILMRGAIPAAMTCMNHHPPKAQLWTRALYHF